MSAAILAGSLIAAGVLLAISGFKPSREPLTVVLGRIGAPQPERISRGTFDAWLGSRLRRLPPIGRTFDRLRTDLRILHKDPDEQAAQMVAPAVIGFLWGPIVASVLAVLGSPIPLIVPVWLAILGGIAGAYGPLRNIRRQADRHREAFSQALAGFCDFVSQCLAGGHGLKSAIDHAAESGDGWAFTEIRLALKTGSFDGLHPWQALGQLAEETGLEDLAELASALELAGEEGTRVREILRTKARVIRGRLNASIEQKGGEAIEAMAMPAMLLAFGFLVFWAYPAFINLANT